MVRFRGKQYPFDSEYTPRNGIRLLKQETVFEPIKAAEFWIDKLNLQKVRQHLISKFITTLPNDQKIPVQTSWDRLLDTLESLPKRGPFFDNMKIEELPKIDDLEFHLEPLNAPELLEDELIPELEGEEFPDDLEEGDFEQEVIPG